MKPRRITSVIAHIDHGKTTLMDSLLAAEGCISKSLAGEICYLDSRQDEQARQITLKLSPVTLASGHTFIDTPGHVDFESLIFSASVLSDNHMIIVDLAQGITPRTYSLVRFICDDRAVLVINKIDKCEDVEELEHVLQQMNGVAGRELFSWEKNNVIISNATCCAGLCHGLFRFGKKNTLKAAFQAYTLLSRKYDEGSVDDLMQKYNIRFKTKKNILSTVMPLHSAVINTIDALDRNAQGSQEGTPSDVDGSREARADSNKDPTADRKEELTADRKEELTADRKEEPATYRNRGDALDENRDEKSTESPGKPRENGQESASNPSISFADSQGPVIENIYDSTPLDRPFEYVHELFNVKSPEKPALLGVTAYGIFKDKNVRTEENVLFLTRLLWGTISTGMEVHTTSSDDKAATAKIERIFIFGTHGLVEQDSVTGPALVGIQGALLKNSAISDRPITFSMGSFFTPFYMTKLVLYDMGQMEDFKAAIRAISYSEQSLHAKKNKYNEVELWCSGRVQFEKISTDLIDSGFSFEIKPADKDFRETVAKCVKEHYKDDQVEFLIQIGPITQTASIPELNLESSQIMNTEISRDINVLQRPCGESDQSRDEPALRRIERPNGNAFYTESSEASYVVESMLSVFTDEGPLIREPVMDTFIHVKLIEGNNLQIYSVLKRELTKLYMEAEPRLCPRFFSVKIFISEKYLGGMHSLGQKYSIRADSEDFDEEKEFFIVCFNVPQVFLEDFLNDIHVKTKGTAYVEVQKGEYSADGDYSSLVVAMREEKGMPVAKKIVEDPEKQRTHRK